MAQGFLLAASLLQAVGSIKAGIDARNAAKKQAAFMEEDARMQAEQKAKDLRKLQAAQAVAYAKSGVTLEGSPLLVMNETKNEGMQEINDILRMGYARAETTRAAGRDAFVAGILNAGAGAAGAVNTYQTTKSKTPSTTTKTGADY